MVIYIESLLFISATIIPAAIVDVLLFILSGKNFGKGIHKWRIFIVSPIFLFGIINRLNPFLDAMEMKFGEQTSAEFFFVLILTFGSIFVGMFLYNHFEITFSKNKKHAKKWYTS